MANEDQPYNDHRLHIEPCLCGNSAPEVSGDDFDADVTCDYCNRDSGLGLGTRGAINLWNKKTTEHKAGIQEFPAQMPWGLSRIIDAVNDLEKEIRSGEDLPHTAGSSKVGLVCAQTIRDTVEKTWKKILEKEIPFQAKST